MSTTKKLKSFGRQLMPKGLLDSLHYPEALLYSSKAGRPSRDMIVIGVVGSKGKTTTSNLLWAALTAAGHTVGQIGTANIRIGDHEELNKWHMTMPGSPVMQKLLSRMKAANCTHVIMEVPSEAQTQWRHIGIEFDMLIFMNVEREIMAAHRNNMEVLHKHNKRVFRATAKAKRKVVDGISIPKTLVINADSPDASAYTDFGVDTKVTFGLNTKCDYQAQNVVTDLKGTNFTLADDDYHINLIGQVNAINATATIAAARTLEATPEQIQKGFDTLKTVPGRMEPIDEGQKFAVFVDYAHDPVSMLKLMETGGQLRPKDKKVIVLFGGQGGGRDQEKLPEMGRIAGEHADIVIVSDDDPYDEPPLKIIDAIAIGAEQAGKIQGKDLFAIQDRRAGIHKALGLAKPGDIVFIACKGADQLMMLAHGKSIPWDDRTVTREELKIILK